MPKFSIIFFLHKTPSVHILKYTQDTFQDSYTKYLLEFKVDVLKLYE